MAFPVDFGRKGRLKAFPPALPLFSGAEKRNPFKLGLGLVSGLRAFLSRSPAEGARAPGRWG